MKPRHIVNFVLTVALLTLVCVVISARVGGQVSDFPGIYAAGKQVAAGRAAHIYVRAEQREEGRKWFSDGQTDAFEPPYALVWTGALAGFEPGVAKWVFDGVLIAAMAAAIVLLADTLALGGRATLVLMGLAVIGGPTVDVLVVGKMVAVGLLGLVLALRLARSRSDGRGGGERVQLSANPAQSARGTDGGERLDYAGDGDASDGRRMEFAAGAAFALMMIKPQEALPFGVFALGARRFRFLAGLAAALAVMVVVSLPFFGIEGYANWLKVLQEASADPAIVGVQFMPTLKGQLLRLHMENGAASLVANIVYGVTLIALGWLGSRQVGNANWWRAGTVSAFTLGLAFAPYMHLYDAILLMPVFALLLLSPLPRAARALVLVDLLLFLTPLTQTIHEQLLTTNIALNAHFAAIVLLGALALYADFAANNHNLAPLGGD